MQLILLDEVHEFGGIGFVLGISTFSQPGGPSGIVVHVEFIEWRIASPLEEARVVFKRVLGAFIFSIAGMSQRVVIFHVLALPVVALDAKVVVAAPGQITAPGVTLEQPLSQRDARRDAIARLVVEGDGLIASDILGIGRIFLLSRRAEGAK